MTRTFVSELSDGDSVEQVLLVRDKQIRTNRNGNLYLQLDLDDRTGTVSARYWNATESEARTFETGDFLSIKGKVQLFQGQLQLIVNSFQKSDPRNVNLADFVPATEKNVDALLAELRTLIGKVADPQLQAIARAFLMDEELIAKFSRAPAGIRNHHAYLGGLLEHVVSLLKVHDRIADLYPSLDHDLLRLGILLHDIGKVRELSFERGFLYSDEGQLIGHLVIGVEMLNDKLLIAGELLGEPIAEELAMRLKHLILSHHGTHEFGSPKLPMTPEAIALHHLDNLDAKIHNFLGAIHDDMNVGSGWTPYDPALGRRLYKGPARMKAAAVNGESAKPKTDLRGGL